jgi:hypothetical protein
MIFSGAICFRVLAAISITVSVTRLFISWPFAPPCQAAPAHTVAWTGLDELCPSRSLQDEVGESDDDHKPLPHVGRLKRLRPAKCWRAAKSWRAAKCFTETCGRIVADIQEPASRLPPLYQPPAASYVLRARTAVGRHHAHHVVASVLRILRRVLHPMFLPCHFSRQRACFRRQPAAAVGRQQRQRQQRLVRT